MSRTLDLREIILPDGLATQISNQFQEWENFRNGWMAETKEVRDYIFATDTQTTSTSHLPWKNSVHIPKLCQIRDNLHANYMAAMFPNDRSLQWEGDDFEAEDLNKRIAVEAYMSNKIRQSRLRTEVSKLVYDWIDYGNCFAITEFIAEQNEDPQTGEMFAGYVGPRVRRVAPMDIVFNPTALSFEESPKIIRAIKTLGALRADIDDHPEMGYASEVFDRMLDVRHRFMGMSSADARKNTDFSIDGFSGFMHYFTSDYVEMLDFYGDIYDKETDTLYKNRLITVVDRSYIIRNIPNPNWLGTPNIFHCGWRLRPDNLYAMGPLNNLVGMQYRIDHLENAKSDSFDLIVHPVIKVKGFVEDFDYAPGERIYASEEGDVEFMRTDLSNVIQADTQIAIYEAKMEEMAGAPKQAMGFRTPGEKTAYEVQVLENGANRIFLNKTSYFEEMFLEPILNSMLEIARRNMSQAESVRVLDESFGAVEFMKLTKEDITAKGKIRPIGARHFAQNANMIQNLTQLANSPIGQDPAVNVHISGKAMAKLVEKLLDLEEYRLVQDNVRIAEQMESQQLLQSAQQIVMEQGAPQGAAPMVQPSPPGQTGGV